MALSRAAILSSGAPAATMSALELPLDREDVVSIMESLLDVNWKLDLILGLLGGVDEEEEE